MKLPTSTLFAAIVLAAVHVPAQAGANDREVARGRYLVQVSGCNDCHTDGYMPRSGKVPEAEWLQGSGMGFAGPCGVTYASNLRLIVQDMSAETWRAHARAERRPPMPWFNLARMSDGDLNAIYRYLKHAGPAGVPAPTAIAPGQPIPTAHIVFVPQPPSGTVPVTAAAKE
ncbi:MAG: cytochrome C [Zoogloeaceae bacterium]|nr:cytochrome C [Zoogloeaceae bacterium]